MKKKKKTRKKAILWITVLVIFGVLAIRQQLIINRLNKEYRAAQELKTRLEQESQRLDEARKLTEREDYIEAAAREKLGLIKPGEILIRDKNRKR